jgi:hypothetical protein
MRTRRGGSDGPVGVGLGEEIGGLGRVALVRHEGAAELEHDLAALVWIWFVFIVRVVNQTLSASVIVRPSRLRYTSPTDRSSKKRALMP